MKSKTYSPKNSDQTRVKQTDNTSRPHHSPPDTTRLTERDTYAQKLKQQQKAPPLETQNTQLQTPMQLPTTDLNPIINALKTLQPLLQILQQPQQ